MNTKVTLFFALICCICITAIGQKRSKRATPAASQRVVCKATSVPQGFVVVGYKPVTTCGGSPELVTKRPEAADIVCADSPVPDGYSVISRAASAACVSGDTNPLSNALFIARNDAAAPSTKKVAVRNDDAAKEDRRITVLVERGGQRDDEDAPVPVSRAAAVHNQTRIELATLHHEIVVGMTKAQVRASWGSPADASANTQSGEGTSSTWTYRRGGQFVDLYFKEETLTKYSWYH